MNLSKRKALMKTFVISQFNYCPLVWMFHSRKLNHRINSIHERALELYIRIINSRFFNYYKKINNSVTIHQRNLPVLATEMFKAKIDLSRGIMKVFELKEPSNSLRSKRNYFVRGNIKTTHYGIQSITYLAPKIWDLVK